MEQTTLVIADDHQIVVEGLASMLNSSDNVNVLATANNMRESVSMLMSHNPNVLLTDLNMPGKNGVEMLKDIQAQFPYTKVIVLTMYYDSRLVKELDELKIDGFLLKNCSREELLEAISTVSNGGHYKHPHIERLTGSYDFTVSMDDEIKDSFLRQFSLGKRELEILLLVALGKSSQEIADSLNISIETVSTHRKNIKYKIGLKNAAEIAAFAVRNQLI